MLKQTILVFILFITSVQAQVINTGGGGPDGHIDGKRDDDLNANVIEQMVETFSKESDLFLEEIRQSWSECYTTKLKAKNLIDLYAQLTIHAAGNGPQVRKKYLKEYGAENCEKSKVFECFLKDQSTQNHLYGLISSKSIHYYLRKKGIDKSESREQLVTFYKDLLKGFQVE